jgi:hypothetical protein
LVRTRPTSLTPPLTISTTSPSQISASTRGTPSVHTTANNVFSKLADPYWLRKPLHPNDYSLISYTGPTASWEEYSKAGGRRKKSQSGGTVEVL